MTAVPATTDPVLGRPNQEIFAATLEELAAAHPELTVVTSDSRGSGKLVGFADRHPEQLVETGIAEQNLVGVAAGLADTGRKVFAVSPACFLTLRSIEQIKNDLCYSDRPVVVVGISAGVSYGALGSTHHSLHDLAVLRAIHNFRIVVPADNVETAAAVRAAFASETPVYLRLGKKPLPVLHDAASCSFRLGEALTVRTGDDLTFVATGETVPLAVAAADQLAADGIRARVLSMHTIKPLDEAAVLAAARETGHLITVEEHSVHGGLGEACASLLLGHGVSPRFRLVGIPDEDTVTGGQMEILAHYGISADGLTATARTLLAR